MVLDIPILSRFALSNLPTSFMRHLYSLDEADRKFSGVDPNSQGRENVAGACLVVLRLMEHYALVFRTFGDRNCR